MWTTMLFGWAGHHLVRSCHCEDHPVNRERRRGEGGNREGKRGREMTMTTASPGHLTVKLGKVALFLLLRQPGKY